MQLVSECTTTAFTWWHVFWTKSSLEVSATILYLSNLMIPLDRILNEGDEIDSFLGVGRIGRLPTGMGNKINNKFFDIRQCLVNMVVLHLLVINKDLSWSHWTWLFSRLLSNIAPPGGQRRFSSYDVDINSPCLGCQYCVVFISKETILIKCS